MTIRLPDDLERRVKAARIPVSEVCQQALLKAVEAAESAQAPLLADGVTGAYRQGAQAGEQWARGASPVTLLTLPVEAAGEGPGEDCAAAGPRTRCGAPCATSPAG